MTGSSPHGRGYGGGGEPRSGKCPIEVLNYEPQLTRWRVSPTRSGCFGREHAVELGDTEIGVRDDRVVQGVPLGFLDVFGPAWWSSAESTDRPITLTFLISNAGLIFAMSPNSVVQTGVKSFGCENSTAHEFPIHSWKRIGPSVVPPRSPGLCHQVERSSVLLLRCETLGKPPCRLVVALCGGPARGHIGQMLYPLSLSGQVTGRPPLAGPGQITHMRWSADRGAVAACCRGRGRDGRSQAVYEGGRLAAGGHAQLG